MSVALQEWRGSSSRVLDEIEALRRQVEGSSIGSRTLLQQVDYSYAALILAHFQRYCRAVHTEAADALASAIPNPDLADVVAAFLAESRLLDRGNPTPGNLSRDFARFGFRLWSDLDADDRHNRMRRQKLEQLCQWRNAVTHGDIPRKEAAGQLVPRALSLDTCRDWRCALGELAISIDKVTGMWCQDLGCGEPW